MRFAGIRGVWVVSCLLAVFGSVDRGLAQRRDFDSDAETTSPIVEWHQRVLKQSQSAVPSSREETSAAVYRTHEPNSYAQPASYTQPTSTRPSSTHSTSNWQPRGRSTVSAFESQPAGRQRVIRTSGEEEVVDPGPAFATSPDPVPSPSQRPIQFEPMQTEGVFEDYGDGVAGPGEMGFEGDDCNVCEVGDGRCRDDYGYECFDGRLNCWWIRDLSVSFGVEGFKGARDLNQNGNFGFHEGLDLAGPLGDPWNVGYQVGVNLEQSDFSGTPATADVQAGMRRQTFVTASLFRRANCSGFQGGLAYDFLNDVYGQDVNLQQLRTEFSYLVHERWEFGYYGACRLNSSLFRNANRDEIRMQSADMYTLFIRRYFDNGGDGRLWGGATDRGDGVLGASLWLPIGKHFALENAATYLIPKGVTGEPAQERESWGLSVSLVWYPGRLAHDQQHNPYRPLFSTANNATFMSQRIGP